MKYEFMSMKLKFTAYWTLRSVIIVLMCISLSVNAYAQETLKLAAPSSMTFDFVQTKSSDMLDAPIVNTGRMAFVSPDKLRWEYVRPYSSLFVMNGERVLTENSGGRKVSSSKSGGAYSKISRIMMPLVGGEIPSGDGGDFSVTFTDRGDRWEMSLTPVKANARRMFAGVVAEIDKKSGVATKVTVRERNGDTTVITCTNIVIDSPVDESLFTF